MNTNVLSNPRNAAAEITKAHSPWRARIGRIGRWLFIAIIVAAVSGLIVQSVATAIDRNSYPAPGQLVEIGEQGRSLRIHLDCVGSGAPTVILESGQGGLSSGWAWVKAGVAETVRVCAYDRAGVGWSDSGPSPRDAHQIVQELHALLGKAELAGPYILVGHSYGGMYVRAYAGAYPGEVAGMVLVDSSHPEQWQRLPGAQQQYSMLKLTYGVGQLLYPLGIHRLIGYNAIHPALPPQQGAEQKVMADTTPFVVTAAQEFDASPATSAQAIAAGTFDDMPLFVLSATEHGTPPESEEEWAQLQHELTTLSSNHLHRVVQGADHLSLLLEEEDAQATVAAILDVINAARSGQLLKAEQ